MSQVLTNGVAAPTNGAQPQPSDEEIDAIAAAAHDLIPVMRFVGRPLSHRRENSVWYWKPDRDHEEKVAATEPFAVDLRSSGEVWKRWGRLDNGKTGIIDQIGGRYVDLGAFVSCFLSTARLLTGSNIHSLGSCPAVSCIEGFCNASEARCLTSTMLMASQKPHR